jgi:alpha-L-fucosidase
VAITSLRRGGQEKRAVKNVRLLGVSQPLKFQQSDSALVVELPGKLPTQHASAFKISFGA